MAAKILLFLIVLTGLAGCRAGGPRMPSQYGTGHHYSDNQEDTPWAKQMLFIGNSLTFYNDMPATLQKMLNAGNDMFVVYQSTFADRSLIDHVRWIDEGRSNMIWPAGREDLAGEVPADVLTDKQWDLVVLQDATLNILVPGLRSTVFKPAVMQLDSMIRSAGAQTLLFQSYPLGIYPSRYCIDISLMSMMAGPNEACSPRFEESFEEMMVLRRTFRDISHAINADVVPVGDAFEITSFRHPDIPLYVDRYDQHPSAQGSYLIACLFYNLITGKRSAGLEEYGGIPVKDAMRLQKVADSFYHRNQFVRFFNRLLNSVGNIRKG